MSRKNRIESKILQTPKGIHDILPADQPWISRIKKVSQDLAEYYGFSRIDTPVLEFAKLFEKGTGEETDIVQKEMYTLKTKGGDTLALRPEFTPSVMRAYFEHSLGRHGQPQKLYTFGPLFRHESPQSGRYRQFNQFDLEVIGGASDPIYDAQVILIFQKIFEELKIRNLVLELNSIGCKVCRPTYKKQLQNYYRNYEKKLCPDCQKRLKTNPLRLLDCKNKQCQEFKEKVPSFFDKLCVACSSHLKGVLEYLGELGIEYELNNRLVRGLDYYSRTVFEFLVNDPKVEVGALAGGGRYDYLMEMLGGRPTPAVGGASGLERIAQVMKIQEVKISEREGKRVFLIHVGELAKKKSLNIIENLRSAGVHVSEALGRESLKAQLKTADKEGFELALIFGQKELFEETIIIRDLKSSVQENVPLSKLIEEIKKAQKG